MDVVIPAFNAERFIGDTIRSVLAQTRTASSITVVDDASTDGTLAVSRSFGSQVSVIANTVNAGPGARRNQGAHTGASPLLAFLDADDVWEPDHVETVTDLLNRFPLAGVAFSRSRMFGMRDEIWPQSIPCEDRPRMAFSDMMRNLFCHIGSAVVRREAFDKVGGFDDIVEFYKGTRVQGEDYDFLLRLSLETPYVGSSKVTFRYRWHEGMSSRHIVPQIVIGFKYRLRLLDRLRADPARADLVPVALDRIQQCWNEHIELVWCKRDLAGLRMMVEFGLSRDELRCITRLYAQRAGLPQWVVSTVDAIKGAGKRFSK